MGRLIYCLDRYAVDLYMNNNNAVYVDRVEYYCGEDGQFCIELNDLELNEKYTRLSKFTSNRNDCDIIVTDHWLFRIDPFEIKDMFFLTINDSDECILTNIQDTTNRELHNHLNIPKMFMANSFKIPYDKWSVS